MKLQQDFTSKCKIYFENDIEINGYSYLVIFGKHINGGFICLPNYWHICCEAADRKDEILYNTEKLINAGMEEEPAKEIAKYIDEWIKNNENI